MEWKPRHTDKYIRIKSQVLWKSDVWTEKEISFFISPNSVEYQTPEVDGEGPRDAEWMNVSWDG